MAKKRITIAWTVGMATNWAVMAPMNAIMDVKTMPHWFLDKRILKVFPTKRKGGPEDKNKGRSWLASKAKENQKRDGEKRVRTRETQSEENSKKGPIRKALRICQTLEKQANARIKDAKISHVKTTTVHEGGKKICL